MRRLEGFSINPRLVNGATCSPPKPSQQLAQNHRAANAKGGNRPGLPQQDVDELVQLRIRHATESSSFVA
jgi:hypothetical protein